MLKATHLSFEELSARLREYEENYGHSTIEFYRRFQGGELGDDDDLMTWPGSITCTSPVCPSASSCSESSTPREDGRLSTVSLFSHHTWLGSSPARPPPAVAPGAYSKPGGRVPPGVPFCHAALAKALCMLRVD